MECVERFVRAHHVKWCTKDIFWRAFMNFPWHLATWQQQPYHGLPWWIYHSSKKVSSLSNSPAIQPPDRPIFGRLAPFAQHHSANKALVRDESRKLSSGWKQIGLYQMPHVAAGYACGRVACSGNIFQNPCGQVLASFRNSNCLICHALEQVKLRLGRFVDRMRFICFWKVIGRQGYQLTWGSRRLIGCCQRLSFNICFWLCETRRMISSFVAVGPYFLQRYTTCLVWQASAILELQTNVFDAISWVGRTNGEYAADDQILLYFYGLRT